MIKYDIRSAETAHERLQGSDIAGRPIDVHYSLPRDDTGRGPAGSDKNQEMQGAIVVILRNSASGQPINEEALRLKFQQFGDVKSIRQTSVE